MVLKVFRVDPALLETVDHTRLSMELTRSQYIRRALKIAVRLDSNLLEAQERALNTKPLLAEDMESQSSMEKEMPA